MIEERVTTKTNRFEIYFLVSENEVNKLKRFDSYF